MADPLSCVIYPDGTAMYKVIPEGSEIELQDIAEDSIAIVDLETGSNVQFTTADSVWETPSTIVLGDVSISGKILKVTDKRVWVKVGSNNQVQIMSYDSITRQEDGVIVLTPAEGKYPKGLEVSYMTTMLSWSPVVSVSTNGDNALAFTLCALIQSQYEKMITADCTIVMRENPSRSPRRSSSESSQRTMMAAPSMAAPFPSTSGEPLYPFESRLGLIAIGRMTSIPISSWTAVSARVDIIYLSTSTTDGQAVSSLVTRALQYIPPSKYSITDGFNRNDLNDKGYQMDELIILPVSLSKGIRYQSVVTEKENKEPYPTGGGDRLVSTTYTIVVTIINTSSSPVTTGLVYKTRSSILNISPSPDQSLSTGERSMWVADIPPNQTSNYTIEITQ
jgi:hypothetical protein